MLLATAATADAQIAFRAAATAGVNASTISVARPTGTVQNDVMLAAISVRGGSSTAITPPAGWTLVQRTDSGTTISVATYWKLAGTAGSDPGPYAFGFSASVRAVGGISSYSGVHLTAPIDASEDGHRPQPEPPTLPTNPVHVSLLECVGALWGGVSTGVARYFT